jgi:hypothetical protein
LPSKLTSASVAIPAFRLCLPSSCQANGHICHSVKVKLDPVYHVRTKFRENASLGSRIVERDIHKNMIGILTFSYKQAESFILLSFFKEVIARV